MGRPRGVPKTEAQRKAAYRARKKAEASGDGAKQEAAPPRQRGRDHPPPAPEPVGAAVRAGKRCPMHAPVGTICKFCGKTHPVG